MVDKVCIIPQVIVFGESSTSRSFWGGICNACNANGVGGGRLGYAGGMAQQRGFECVIIGGYYAV